MNILPDFIGDGNIPDGHTGKTHTGLEWLLIPNEPADGSYIPLIDCGYGNGYIGLPKQHPFYNKDYTDIYQDNINIPGGLTFSQLHNGLWVIGFDTLHAHQNLENTNKDICLEYLVNLCDVCDEIYYNVLDMKDIENDIIYDTIPKEIK